LGAAFTAYDQFSNQRVVVGRNALALEDAPVVAHTRPLRRPIDGEDPRRWQEVLERVFGHDPKLQGEAARRQIALRERKLLSGGDGELQEHEIEPVRSSAPGCSTRRRAFISRSEIGRRPRELDRSCLASRACRRTAASPCGREVLVETAWRFLDELLVSLLMSTRARRDVRRARLPKH
jgi:hypothetical protein